MTNEKIMDLLNEIFRAVFDNETLVVSPETTAQDINGWDSVMHMTLIDEIEHRFSIKFEMLDVIKTQNVGQMVSVIKRLSKCN